MKLKEITLVLENCDQITFDGNHIGAFVVDDIKTSIERIAMNAIIKMETPRTFFIEIHKDANTEHYELGQADWKETKFGRLLAWADITQIEFTLFDQYAEEGETPAEESYHFYLDWDDGENDCINANQKSYLSKNGHLYIMVSKEDKLEDAFDMEWLDDENYWFIEW